MADVDGTLILDHLKKIQGTLSDMSADIVDMKVRMSALEGHVAQQTVQMAALNTRMDRFDERLKRVERRLDLTDA